MEYSTIEAFDVRADAFRRMTGMMAPGKSEPLEMAGMHTDEEKREAFNEWWKCHGDCVRAVMKATESICWRSDDDA